MEKTFKQSTANLIRPLWGVMAALLTLVAATSCNNSSQGVEESINDAAIAITDGDWNHAQATCNHLLKTITGPDSTIVTEQQAARLGILFMKLSEQQREYDNVADAIECLRHAYRMSTDSLSAFSASLPPEDERQFVLLRRIGISIDHPVDLYDKDSLYDGDSAAAYNQTAQSHS